MLHFIIHTALYYTVLYYTMLYYTILYCTILYYTVLYNDTLYYTVLYVGILNYIISSEDLALRPWVLLTFWDSDHRTLWIEGLRGWKDFRDCFPLDGLPWVCTLQTRFSRISSSAQAENAAVDSLSRFIQLSPSSKCCYVQLVQLFQLSQDSMGILLVESWESWKSWTSCT